MITGGFNAKGELAQSIQYKCTDNVTHTFVALHKEAQWFVKGVGGARKGELKAVNVLTMIRQKANVIMLFQFINGLVNCVLWRQL